MCGRVIGLNYLFCMVGETSVDISTIVLRDIPCNAADGFLYNWLYFCIRGGSSWKEFKREQIIDQSELNWAVGLCQTSKVIYYNVDYSLMSSSVLGNKIEAIVVKIEIDWLTFVVLVPYWVTIVTWSVHPTGFILHLNRIPVSREGVCVVLAKIQIL